MSSARQFAARLLLVLWLPALLHCQLEAAGLLFGSDCCEAAKSAAPEPDGCGGDACDIAEGAFAPRTTSLLGAPVPPPAPGLPITTGTFPPPAVLPPPPVGLQDAATAPPELRRTWVFRSRAALPARAP